jgi:mRNA interferase RelE/StbE
VNEYKLGLKRSAEKELLALDDKVALRVAEAINALMENPFPHGAIKLTDRSGYRTRVGDYRILYEVDTKAHVIEVTAIRHRRDAYD